jgi:SAM-dependent methyltransferase
MTDGLRKEVALAEVGSEDAFASVSTAEDMHARIASIGKFSDVLSLFPKLADGQHVRVLDVGVGDGETSLYLGSLGYEVVAVEPVKRRCRQITEVAGRCGWKVTPFLGIGERLGEVDGLFDTVVFHSSLHHCDDPQEAVRQSFAKLKPGGKLYLLSEPLLKVYWSREKFERLLEEHPKEMGHYGGNEHIYRFSEYVAMLRSAGFGQIRTRLSYMYSHPPFRLAGDNAKRFALKKAFYRSMRFFGRTPVGWLLQRLSLANTIFVGTRPSDT